MTDLKKSWGDTESIHWLSHGKLYISVHVWSSRNTCLERAWFYGKQCPDNCFLDRTITAQQGDIADRSTVLLVLKLTKRRQFCAVFMKVKKANSSWCIWLQDKGIKYWCTSDQRMNVFLICNSGMLCFFSRSWNTDDVVFWVIENWCFGVVAGSRYPPKVSVFDDPGKRLSISQTAVLNCVQINRVVLWQGFISKFKFF